MGLHGLFTRVALPFGQGPKNCGAIEKKTVIHGTISMKNMQLSLKQLFTQKQRRPKIFYSFRFYGDN
jgi:hypothetical protein